MGSRGLRKNDGAAIRLGASGPAHELDADSGATSIRPQLISNCPGEARDSVEARPGEYYASTMRVWWREPSPLTSGRNDNSGSGRDRQPRPADGL
jgi:hypothetical protein